MPATQRKERHFRDAEHARAWLIERLDRLEESVADAADLHHIAGEMSADAMSQLEGDPLGFRKTAIVHLRDVQAAVTEAASSRATREGFNVAALERLMLETIGRDPAHGRDVIEGLLAGLRDRVEHLATRAGNGHDEAQERLDEALAALDQSLQRVVRRWEGEAMGVWNRWRRRRRMRLQGIEQLAGLPELQLGLAEAARELRPSLEAAWDHGVRGARALGIARSYTEVLDWLTDVSTGLGAMARQGGEIARDAEQRLRRIDGAWGHSAPPDRRNLLDFDLLDRVLEHLNLDSAGFFGRSDVGAVDLGRLGRQGLEAELRRWVEGEVARLPDPTLAEVLGGYATEADIVGPLARLLADGQPLLGFNDDLHRMWPGGLSAHYHVIVESTDGTLSDALGDACIQVGLPAPQIELVEPPADRRVIALRFQEMVSGLAWPSAAERLMPMTQVHEEVMAEADRHLQTREGLRAALRDSVESEQLGHLLPEEVRTALTELERIRAKAQASRPAPAAPVRNG
jgi:hypothetical protein